jgi:hypothetical protein
MRSLVVTSIVALFLSTAGTGCVAMQRGTTQVKWEPGEANSRVIPALETGQYALLKGTDYKPQFVVHVNAGEDLGFEQRNGVLYAVYGSHHDALTDKDSRYYWNYRGK